MNENLKQAILKMKEMPEVQEKLTKSVGSGFTLDEFKAAMEEMNKAGSGELTDEQLDAVAGGAFSVLEYLRMSALASKGAIEALKNE